MKSHPLKVADTETTPLIGSGRGTPHWDLQLGVARGNLQPSRFTSPAASLTPMNRYLHLHQGGHHMFEGLPAFPFFGWGMMLIWLPVFFVIAFLVYRDANRRGMNGLLWFILVILPMVGFIFLILYLVIREPGGVVQPAPTGDTAMDLLRERYARGEIDEEEFRKRREELEQKN
jgi:putative membrane protein